MVKKVLNKMLPMVAKSDKGVSFDNIFSQFFEFSASKFTSPRARV
jgi:hypothetical protein